MSTKANYQIGDHMDLRFDLSGEVLDGRGTLVELSTLLDDTSSRSSSVSMRITEYLTKPEVVELRDLLTRAIDGNWGALENRGTK